MGSFRHLHLPVGSQKATMRTHIFNIGVQWFAVGVITGAVIVAASSCTPDEENNPTGTTTTVTSLPQKPWVH